LRSPSKATYFFYAFFFLSAHRAFIITDNLFRIAALIGFRPGVFLETGIIFFGADLPFCFAHQAFFAAAILARADALMRRRFGGAAFRAIDSKQQGEIEFQNQKFSGYNACPSFRQLLHQH